MKILMSAYACEPGCGSEPGAGWAWASVAAREHDVWVLTHPSHAGAIERALAADASLGARLHPLYLECGRWARPLLRNGPSRFLYYFLWQLTTCRRTARALHAQVGFDIAHHVTYAADWMPAGVSALPGVPFVWGPVGGSATTGGPRLWALLGARSFASELVRAVVTGACRVTVGRRLARRAAVVLGQNADVAAAFAPLPVVVEPHVALETGGFDAPRQVAGHPPRALWAGRLLGWKGVRLSLAALRRPEAAHWQLDLFGDGPQRRRLERLAHRWGVADRVRFLGARPRVEVLDALSRADVLLFPSIHDAAGWAVAEAMAAGCPVLGLDLGGPAALVGPGDGVLVDPSADVVAGLARGLDRAAAMRPRRDAWSAERLPAVLRSVYRDARAGQPGVEPVGRR